MSDPYYPDPYSAGLPDSGDSGATHEEILRQDEAVRSMLIVTPEATDQVIQETRERAANIQF
jgi:hypothetical protein